MAPCCCCRCRQSLVPLLLLCQMGCYVGPSQGCLRPLQSLLGCCCCCRCCLWRLLLQQLCQAGSCTAELGPLSARPSSLAHEQCWLLHGSCRPIARVRMVDLTSCCCWPCCRAQQCRPHHASCGALLQPHAAAAGAAGDDLPADRAHAAAGVALTQAGQKCMLLLLLPRSFPPAGAAAPRRSRCCCCHSQPHCAILKRMGQEHSHAGHALHAAAAAAALAATGLLLPCCLMLLHPSAAAAAAQAAGCSKASAAGWRS